MGDLGPCLDALQEKTFRGCPPRFGYYREAKFETKKINVTFETLVFLFLTKFSPKKESI